MNQSVVNQFLASRITNRKNYYIHPSFDLEEQLLDCISRGEKNQALAVLEKINSTERATLALNEIRSMKNSLIAQCTLFTRAIMKSGVHPETAYHLSDAYILEIEKTGSLVELQALETDMLLHFIKTGKEESETNNFSFPVKQAITCINDNILEELSLTTISKHTFLHPSYLSNLFKKEVGVSLTEYINQKRIEESKYFLRHTNTSISDIALLFKFCNQSYYTSLFKKYTGMTPRVFRGTEKR